MTGELSQTPLSQADSSQFIAGFRVGFRDNPGMARSLDGVSHEPVDDLGRIEMGRCDAHGRHVLLLVT